jgi:Ribonuclease H2 non-catalytic subunit (Ylr154p-like)
MAASAAAKLMRPECHALPCSIDYSGKAPVADYFRPAPIDGGDGTLYQAATLRGRALLARVRHHVHLEDNTTSHQPVVVQGVVLQKAAKLGNTNKNNSSGSAAGTTTSVMTPLCAFDKFTEWHHEHLTAILDYQATDSTTRLTRAMEWMEVASALHAPLPVPAREEGAAAADIM